MTLINTTEDLKAANSAVVHDLDFDSISSYIFDASVKDIIPAIGRPTYAIICGGGDGAGLAVAMELARKAEANLGIAYYVNMGSVKLGENGAHVFQDERHRIASDKKISALCNQSRMDGYRALDSLLEHLEANLPTFPLFEVSTPRIMGLQGFVNTTADFNEALYIDSNPLLFRSLRTYIRDAETEYIIPLLGDDYADGLINKLRKHTCTPIEAKLLKQIAKAVAPYAIAEAIPYRAISFDANGVFTNTIGASADAGNVEKQTAAETKRLLMAMTALQDAGNKNLDRLRKFISKNKDALTGINEVILNTRSTLNDAPRGFFFV